MRSDAFAGVERYLTYVGPELARRGHEVTVVGGDPARMEPVLGPAGIVHAPARTTADVVGQLVRHRRQDLLHTHMTAADVAAALAWPAVRRPIVSTLHFADRRGGSGAKAVAYRGLDRVIDRDIAISEFVAASVGGSPLVIPNGIPDPGVGRDGDREPVVLVAQRLEAEKDTATIIRAWSRSGLGDRGWVLVVAGNGAEAGVVRREVEASGGAGSIRLVGAVGDVIERMRAASVFVASAPAEAFGLSVVEAMATGLPVIASDGGAHREVLGSGEQLVPPGAVDAMAARLVQLADDPAERNRLGAANRVRFERTFTVEVHVDRLEALYAEVASPAG